MGQLPGRTFGEQLMNWHKKVVVLNHDVFVGSAQLAHQSIQEGSAITGAPGQPVGQYGEGYHQGYVGGTLKASWQLWFPDAHTAEIGTKLVYAPPNEYGVTVEGHSYIQRSTVGGRHSVAQTVQHFDKIVEHVTREVTGNG